MCGIAGVFGPFTKNEISRKLERMCKAIHHRGPDDKGFSAFPQQGIGMTRLSIIDIEGGHQPIWLDDKVGIVFNGEIYNYIELRESLLKQGASFRTHSDTEVILQLYYYEGIEGLDKLEGMYSICILDQRYDKAFLIRDPIGIKPFYYGRLDGGFYFASEIKSILAACKIKPQVNLQCINDYLSFRYVPAGPQTVWKNIYKLQSGHKIEYNLKNHTFSVNKYWSPDFNSAPLDPCRNYEEEFEDLFLKSVNQQLLASDVPVGACLSGGIDSSAICAAAVELGHKNFHTYSVAFKGDKKHNELSYANLVARHLKTNHHDVFVTIDGFKEFMEEQPWYTDEPLADLTTVPLYFLSKEAKKDVKAILCGDGADEFLAGYQYNEFAQVSYRRQMQLSRIPKFLFSMASHFFREGTKRKILFESLGQFGWKGYIRPILKIYSPQFTEDEKRKLWAHGDFESTCRINENLLENCLSKNPIDLNMSIMAHDCLVEEMLMKADKMTMAASLESRVPFLSRELMEWCLLLPLEWKVGTKNYGFTTKKILRNFSIKRLPKEIINRKKQGFPIPVYDWLPNQLKGWATDVLFHQKLLDDWFDMREVKNIFDKAMQNSVHHQNNIFELITLAFWKKNWD